MADQEIDIRLNTRADTRGAKNATRSIQDLERELRDATKAFRGAAAGSKEFTAAASRIKSINKQIATTSRAAGALGSRGNGGMAVLEFSRAFEDAQYGIRGVLNNIPLLVASLGGGAGLAGVISIAAVAGSQLWSRLNGGAKEGKEAVDEYKEAFDKAMEAFSDQNKLEMSALKESAKEGAQALKEGLEINDDTNSAALFLARTEFAISQSEELLELAKLGVKEENLAYLEASSSGQEAVKYAKQREEIIQSILDKEKEMAEAKRQQAMREQRLRILDASRDLTTTTQALEGAQDNLADRQAAQAQAQGAFDQARNDRLSRRKRAQQRLQSLNAEIEAKMDAQRYATGPGFTVGQEVAEANRLKKEIQELGKKTEAEAKLEAGIRRLDEQVKEATATMEELAEATRLAQREFDEQSTGLDQLKQTNNAQRVTEARALEGNLEGQASGAIQGILKALTGTEGAPARDMMQIQGATDRLRGYIGDDVGDASQAAQVASVLQSLQNNLVSRDKASLDAIKEASTKLKQVARQYEALQNEIRNIQSAGAAPSTPQG